ncbi:hypothetical protein M9Y10_000857 [Tritrichomonas musculus]|uniref:Uncharacterized protein n=1 Tax=Tritrichomonas musculus TaxID=1915356 RepID=A0ABR2L8H8_9EUKA
MEIYKLPLVDRFFDLQTVKSTLSYEAPDDDNQLQLDQFKTQRFRNELPNFLKNINEIQQMDEENLSMSINALANFSRYNPKDTIAKILIDSGAVDMLVNYGSNDIVTYISNPIFYKNICNVFNIFGEISKSTDQTIIFIMMQKGVLTLCIKNQCIIDDFLNKTICFILKNFISSSFFSRAMVYSTKILSSIELSGNTPLILYQHISAITEIFASKGTKPDDPVKWEPQEKCFEFWNTFMQNYYSDDIFDKNEFENFVKNGLKFSVNEPLYEICNRLLPLNDNICVLNCLKTLFILVDCDCRNFPPQICENICLGGLSFLASFSKYLKTKSKQINEYALKIVYRAFSPKKIHANNLIANDVAAEIINFLINSRLNLDEIIIAYASNSLTNILETIDYFSFISSDINSEEEEEEPECENILLFIYQALRCGSFRIRKTILFFYMTLVVYHLDNKRVNKSLGENINEILSIIEFIPDVDLKIKFVKNIKYILDVEYDNNDEKFLSLLSNNNGFEIICNFTKDENKELAEISDQVINLHYDGYMFDRTIK